MYCNVYEMAVDDGDFLGMFQVCDIKLPEVQERLNQFSKDSAYDAKTGWLSEEFFDFVREQIDKHIIALLQNTNGLL